MCYNFRNMTFSESELHRDADNEHAQLLEVPQLLDVAEFSAGSESLNEYVLNKEIYLPKQPFEYNGISPTPLDPYNLKAQGMPYFEAAGVFMHLDVRDKALSAGLPVDSSIITAVSNEVDYQHLHRSQRNDESMGRFRKKLRTPLTPYEAGMALRVRAALGASHEPGLLLSKVPEMEGVEGMKATRFLDRPAIEDANRMYIGDLMKAAHNNKGFHINRLYDLASAEQVSWRNMYEADEASHTYCFKDSVAVVKWVQMDMTINDVPIELVSRNSYVFLPPEIYLDGVMPNMIQLQNGNVVNAQPIDVTKYFRVKKDTTVREQ